MNDSSASVILEVDNLHRSFRSGASTLNVLAGIDLQLHAGEVCALRGSSGSGKSTLLHILGLLDRADRGSIRLNGKEVSKISSAKSAQLRAQEIGFIFQQFQLLPELSALENVLIPRRLLLGFKWWSQRKQEREAAIEALHQVNLADRLSHRPNQLSGGEQQRVAIARAMISRPKLLLADEPTGNLDQQNGEEILNFMLNLAAEAGTAILLATHDLKIANACQRTLHVKNGRLEDLASPSSSSA